MKNSTLNINYMGEKPSPNSIITDIHFIYKNTRISINSEDDLNGLIQEFEKVSNDILQEDKMFLLEQLDIIKEDYIDAKEDLPEQYKHVFMMNIYWLTKMGIIQNDENNGMVIQYS